MSSEDRGDRHLRLLITGAGGLLGGRLALELARRYPVVAAVRGRPAPVGLPSVSLELRDERALRGLLEAGRIDAVVHAATLNVDECERQPELAQAVNVSAAERLARLCRRLGLPLLALSTDLVFDGSSREVAESAHAHPLSVYGRTKLLGEERVLNEAPDAAVVRVALAYGPGHGGRGTASECVAWTIVSGRNARLYADQFRTPIDAASLADLVARLLEGGGRGLYHAGGPECLSRLDLGRRTAEVLGLDAARLEAVTETSQPQEARRPREVALISERARRELGWQPRPLAEAIREQRARPDA